MQSVVDQLATWTGLDESEAAEALNTIQEAIAPGSRARAEELIFRLASRLGIPRGQAVEVAQIGCHSIAASLEPDARRQLMDRLPGDLRELFAAPASATAPGAHPSGLPRTAGHTIAEGRPGSENPLSSARPGSSHPLSESREPVPRTR